MLVFTEELPNFQISFVDLYLNRNGKNIHLEFIQQDTIMFRQWTAQSVKGFATV